MGTSEGQPFNVLPRSAHDGLDQFRSETDALYEITPPRHGNRLAANTLLTPAALGLAATLAVILFTSTLVTSTQPTNRIDATTPTEHSVEQPIMPEAPAAAAVAARKSETSDARRRVASPPIRRPIARTKPTAKTSTPNGGNLRNVDPPRNRTAAAAPRATAVLAANDRPEPSDPASTLKRPVAVPVDAEVTAITSHADRTNLRYRWSAPVGAFTDAAAGQTKFVCPESPQSVRLTVTVTDANGGVVTDTVTVQCGASEK